MNLGKQIHLLRLKKSISPEEMAEVLGVSAQMVSGWERGAVLPETRFLPSMATLFGVTVDELFGFSDDELLQRMENTDWNRNMDDFVFNRHADYLTRKRAAEPYNARVRIIAAQLYDHRARADREKSAACAREALEIAPEDAGAWSALVSAMDGPALIEYLMGFAGIHPGNLRALQLLVENLISEGRCDEAEPFINEFSRIPGGEYLFLIYSGDIALARGDRRDAMQKWESSAEVYRDSWKAHDAFALRLGKMGLFSRALLEYDKSYALQPVPRTADPLHARARIFERQGRWEEAVAERRRIIDALAENFGVTRGEMIEGQLREIERLKAFK